jgi:uncharacterized membrane protein YkvA (DUF1232 family)
MKNFLEKLKEKARELKRETYVLFLAYKSPATPWYAKVFGAVVVAYAFSPIDLIPDFIPILGYLDDLILVPLGIALALKMIPEEVLVEARVQAEQEFVDGKPKNWVAGAVIILIWLIILTLVIYWTVRWIAELRSGVV